MRPHSALAKIACSAAKSKILGARREGLHHAFVVVAEHAVAVDDLDVGQRRGPILDMKVREVHVLLGQATADQVTGGIGAATAPT